MAVFILRGTAVKKGIPVCDSVTIAQGLNKRCVSSDLKCGSGGRSSFSGIVATVFGATGFYGRYIVNRLGRVGSQVIAPYRGDEHDYRHLRPMGDLGQIVFPSYNLRDVESITKAVKYSNVVINLIGRDYETRNFKFSDTHVEGAKVIAEACRNTGVSMLVHVSALGAKQDSPSRFLQSKAEGELVVKSAFPEATIIRPAATYGNEDRYFNYYASLRGIPFNMLPLLEKGLKTYKYPVYVSDIATAVMNIISDPDTQGKTYEFVGPKKYQLLELVDYLYRVMHRPFKPLSLPPPVFRLTAWALELSPFIPYMTRDILIRLHLIEQLSGGLPGLEDVGVTPTNMEDVALTILRRYRQFVHFKKSIDEIEPSKI